MNCEICGNPAEYEHQGKHYCEEHIKEVSIPTEIWTRVVGYLRPVSGFNIGKKQEFKDRRMFRVPQRD